jgi:hypothetical protein
MSVMFKVDESLGRDLNISYSRVEKKYVHAGVSAAGSSHMHACVAASMLRFL